MKYQRVELAIINNIRFILVLPTSTNDDKYPLYCIEYFNDGKQTKVKEGIKALYLDNVHLLDGKSPNEKTGLIRQIFKTKVEEIVSAIQLTSTMVDVNLTVYTPVKDAFDVFFKYHENRHSLGEIKDIYNYRERNKKVNGYLATIKDPIKLSDLTANFWVNYRLYLNNLGLGNSTINLQMVYIKMFYIWLQDMHELPIHNHANKLKKLDISQQKPKFNEINNQLFIEFFETVGKNDRYLRLHLMARLVAENTLRPIQVRHIQLKHIDVENGRLVALDGKGKRWRTVLLSQTTKKLIQTIIDNTLAAKRIPSQEDFLIGFKNQTKPDKPFTQSMFRERIEMPFKEEYPQFENILMYDFKHTSITKAFTVNSLFEVQKRAGHRKVTTTQIYDRSESISSPITIEELIKIG